MLKIKVFSLRNKTLLLRIVFFFKESVFTECNINFKKESLTNTYLNDKLTNYVSNNNYEERVFQIGIYGDENKEYLLSFNLLDNTYYEIEEKSNNIVSSYVFTYALSLYSSLFDKHSSEF